jgi:hypothetical protein
MAIFKKLAGALNKPLALSPPMRSALVASLLQQSQNPQGIVSPYGTANKALQGLLMRRSAIADRQESETRQDREQGLAGALSRASTQIDPTLVGDDLRTAQAKQEAARRAATIISGGIPENPVAKAVLGAQVGNVFGAGGEGYTLGPGQQRFGANNQMVASVPADPKEGENAIPKLVNDISDDLRQESQEFNVQLESMGRIRQAAVEPSAAGDMALVFGYMKMLDPTSSVRETEYANAENARGVPASVRNIWNRVMEGKILEDEQRGDFVNRAERIFMQSSANQGRRNDRFMARAISAGVPGEMFRPLLVPLSPAALNQQPGVAPAPQPRAPAATGPARRVIP